MAGRPGKHVPYMTPAGRPVDVVAKNVRRTHTTNPQYHAFMPRMFPFKLTVSLEEALKLCAALCQEMEDDGALRLWHALTGHSKALDGHVTLWLSRPAAEYMLEADWVGAVEETVWKPEILERKVENASDRSNPKKMAKERKERGRMGEDYVYGDEGRYDENDGT